MNTDKLITLTNEELITLDDGQDWYTQDDTVTLGGYLPEGDDDNPASDLTVNGYVHDNWMYWSDMPDDIQARLLNA